MKEVLNNTISQAYEIDNVSTTVERALLGSTITVAAAAATTTKLSSLNSIENTMLDLNPFFHDKRKWDDSFTVAEKKQLTGNIVKAAKDNDGETNVTLQKEEFTLPKLSHEEEEDSSQQDSDDFISIYTKKPGRKPMSNEESLSDLDQDPKIKRKAQNRAAQRAFRERKERYVKELEARLKQVQDTYLIVTTELVQENQQLRDVIQRLDAENCVLKGSIPVSSSYPFNENISSQFPNMNPLLSITNHPSSIASLPFCLLSTTASSTLSSNSIKTLASNDPLQPYSSISSSIHMQNKDHDLSSSITKSLPTSLPVKKILSKPSSSSSTATTTTTNQPLEYTFSISTPASLRPTERSKATKQPSEPIKLVQLYPPNESLQSIKSRRKGNNNDNATVMKKSLPNKTVSITNGTKKEVMNHNKEADKIHNMNDNQMFTTNIASSSNNIILQDNTSSINHDNFTTHSQYKGMQQLESSMLDCHIDIERHLFCEKLRYEVCGGQLDPLSDQKGKLNKSIPTQHDPLQPFLSKEENKDSLNDDNHTLIDRLLFNSNDNEGLMINIEKKNKSQRLLTSTEIWYALNQHGQFHKFTRDELCQAIKKLARCTYNGPVIKEVDFYQIISKMDEGHL